MASASRALWKGAISFGLVHIPVSLHTATVDSGIDFDWLDKRSMEPVGYKRINKVTGKEIDKDNIVRGVAHEPGEYVVLTDDEIRAAYPTATQSIEIESFVSADEIPLVFLERPYYLEPLGKGQKVYALLREALLRRQRVGVARVVIQTKQHLAVLVPSGPGLVLMLLRWAQDIRSWEGLALPPQGAKAAGLGERELGMAEQLIDDMTGPWKPDAFHDAFKDDLMALVAQKAKAGHIASVAQPTHDKQHASKGADIIELTELLRQSLRGRGTSASSANAAPATVPAASDGEPKKGKAATKASARRQGTQPAVARSQPTKARAARKRAA